MDTAILLAPLSALMTYYRTTFTFHAGLPCTYGTVILACRITYVCTDPMRDFEICYLCHVILGGVCGVNGEGRGVHRVLVGKPERKRPLGRPRRRWKDNIKMDLQEVGGGCGDWMELAQDRDRWRALVSTVRTFGFQKCGEFLD